MKPFNLEAAKAGAPVITRDGRGARITCFDNEGDYPILALIEGNKKEVYAYNSNGSMIYGVSAPGDLFMDLVGIEVTKIFPECVPSYNPVTDY